MVEEEAHQVLEAQVVQKEAQVVQTEAQTVVQEALGVQEASCREEGVACQDVEVRAFHGDAWEVPSSLGACCDLWRISAVIHQLQSEVLWFCHATTLSP